MSTDRQPEPHRPLVANDTAVVPRPHRYPLQALADAMGFTLGAACRQLGVSGSTQQDYRDRGVTEKVADRLACRAGLHPFEVWPEMADHQIEAVSVECADQACTETFIPNRPWQTYCADACRLRARSRRRQAARRRADPAREAARKARWAAESREYLKAYKRRWDEENREHRNAYARKYRRHHKADATKESEAA